MTTHHTLTPIYSNHGLNEASSECELYFCNSANIRSHLSSFLLKVLKILSRVRVHACTRSAVITNSVHGTITFGHAHGSSPRAEKTSKRRLGGERAPPHSESHSRNAAQPTAARRLPRIKPHTRWLLLFFTGSHYFYPDWTAGLMSRFIFMPRWSVREITYINSGVGTQEYEWFIILFRLKFLWMN